VISASITSPSDWVSGSVESISGSLKALSRSSGSGGSDGVAMQEYRRDLRAYATAFVRTGGSSDEFLRGVGQVAERHGITDWEAEPGTLVAIGEGLRQGQVGEPQLEILRRDLADDPRKLDLVLQGYHSPES
jgi:hypothetical protein